MGLPRRNDLFQPYQLLPPAYNNQRRVIKAICAWSAIVCTLLAILGGLIGAAALEAERDYQARQQTVATALPLLDLRRDVLRARHSNRQRSRWCDWVESARPDGNAFETLAAIATTSQSDGRSVRIDRILVKMPLEFPAAEDTPPEWAAAQVNITARVSSLEIAKDWMQRLNASDRISDVQIAEAPFDLSGGRVEIIASPITTRVLP